MKYRGQALTSGPMVKSTRANGSTIRCTAMVISGGLMAKNTTDNFLRTSAMVRANSDGRMEENTKERGAR